MAGPTKSKYVTAVAKGHGKGSGLSGLVSDGVRLALMGFKKEKLQRAAAEAAEQGEAPAYKSVFEGAGGRAAGSEKAPLFAVGSQAAPESYGSTVPSSDQASGQSSAGRI